MPRVIVLHYEEDPQAQADYQLEMGDFWDDTVNFERAVFLSKLYSWPDLDAQTNRLKEGISEMSEAVGEYLGDKIGSDFKMLMMERLDKILQVCDIVVSGGNTDQAVLDWVNNNSAMADLFANIDSRCWPRAISVQVLNDLTTSTVQQFTARHAQNWSSDIAYYDAAHESAMQWANVLARGVIHYKPDAFVKWTETLVGYRRIRQAIHKVQCTGTTGP